LSERMTGQNSEPCFAGFGVSCSPHLVHGTGVFVFRPPLSVKARRNR
jgi:hypothetical protein